MMASVQNWNLGTKNPYSDLGFGTPLSTMRRTSEPTSQTQTATVEGASPEDIASAYQSSYGDLLENPSNFGVTPEETSARYSKITDYLRDKGRSGFLGELAERGYAPTGGTPIEGFASIEGQLGAQQAEQELGALERLRVRRGNVAGQSAAGRYNALVNRRKTTTQATTTTPGAVTQTNYQPNTFGGFAGVGSASNPYRSFGQPAQAQPPKPVEPTPEFYPGNINEGFNLQPTKPANWDYPFAGGEYPTNPYRDIPILLPNELT